MRDKILFVNDEPSAREGFRRALHLLGYVSRIAVRGVWRVAGTLRIEEGQQFVGEFGETTDVLDTRPLERRALLQLRSVESWSK